MRTSEKPSEGMPCKNCLARGAAAKGNPRPTLIRCTASKQPCARLSFPLQTAQPWPGWDQRHVLVVGNLFHLQCRLSGARARSRLCSRLSTIHRFTHLIVADDGGDIITLHFHTFLGWFCGGLLGSLRISLHQGSSFTGSNAPDCMPGAVDLVAARGLCPAGGASEVRAEVLRMYYDVFKDHHANVSRAVTLRRQLLTPQVVAHGGSLFRPPPSDLEASKVTHATRMPCPPPNAISTKTAQHQNRCRTSCPAVAGPAPVRIRPGEL